MTNLSCDPNDDLMKRVKSDCKMKIYCRWTHYAILSLCLLTLLASSAALEIDSDLVFDDGGSSNNELKSNTEHHKITHHKHRSNTTFVLIKRKVDHTVAPVASPMDTPITPSEERVGIIDHLHDFGRRIKRGFLHTWGLGGSTATEPTHGDETSPRRNKRQRQYNEEDNEVVDVPRQRADTDDEDDDDGLETGSSSGISEVGLARYYRVTLTVHEPFRSEFNNRNSPLFKQLARNLSAAIEQLYRDTPGRQAATLINIQETPDQFFVKLTFDLGTQDYYDSTEIRERLRRQIGDYMKLGSLQVNSDNFTFRKFEDRTRPNKTPCGEEELSCRSGECLSSEMRCNGEEDCSDGSDEIGCPATTPPSTSVEKQTIDRCRADDKVRCADGSIYICTVQKCDGKADCPTGDDELNCPNDCAEGEMMCDLTRCIPTNKRCNGEQDCSDGTDEQDCPSVPSTVRPSCKEDDFRCSNGMCIEYFRRCDEVFDCADRDDEIGCNATCHSSEWQCDFGSCIDRALRCDGKVDCNGDDSDERQCPCTRDQYQCNNTYCIAESKKCDGYNDCQDGSDEKHCPGCAANEFMCRSDRTCIPLQLKCNRQRDCSDGSDEDDSICGSPPCRSDQFRCEDGLCLNINQRCNKIQECYNGEDERGCGCRSSQFECRDRNCVEATARCNGYPECPDGSDEDECVTAPIKPPSCEPNYIRCGDGECVSPEKRCDRIFDCVDGADERDCDNCLPGQFQCRDRTCVEGRYRCNGSPECRDRSDEENCPPVNEPDCRRDEFRCGDGQCINEGFKCDGFKDCSDDSDEQDCPNSTPAPVTCATWQYTCLDGSCVDKRLRCDGRPDCRDRSDETDCGCQASEFTCSNGDCVPMSSRCNRRYECRDGSDERDCPPPTPATTPAPSRPGCTFYQFSCRSGGQCVPQAAVCNFRYECNDRSDEDNCPNRPTDRPTEPGRLNLKTYPPDQIIKEIAAGREVVFQCRDEGPLRARVRWVRGNNLPLPPGSRDNNGRLEMPNIQLEHSGTYVCEAVGYPKSTPGSEVLVTLQVEAFEPLPTRPPTACGLTEATCANGECIRKQLVCDGRHDCSDGSDEMRCSPHGCEPNEFRCANKKCVLKTWRCDSENDCGDNSDEDSCATNPPGSPCKYHEFQCRSGTQCIPRSFHCDQEIDCQDGSDEIGCSPVYVQKPPPPMIMLEIGQLFTITCTAVGVPTPEISWRLNWGHIPEKCVTSSANGVGTLTCDDIQEADQGAYSCEAINNRGSVIAVPDTILVIKKQESPCQRGYFNEEAKNPRECISCFCFGVSTDCKSADLFTYQLPPPFDEYKLLSVRVPGGGGPVTIRPDFLFGSQPPTIRPGKQGFQVNARSNERIDSEIVPYFAIPQNYHGNQLKSYGGYLKYTVRYEGTGRPVQAPDVILTGNDYTLVHTSRIPLSAGRDTDMSVRFFYGEWYKRDGSRPGGDIPSGSGDTLATREEIMMALGDVDNILIKSQYITGPTLVTSITNINMDSAGLRNTGQGKSSYVEECRCPVGYSGLSCENCISGYERSRSGLWLGSCTREPTVCRPGTYGDPSRGIPCEPCPCPLTNPGNQFGRTCHLDTDNQVTCDCPPAYTGRRCESCAIGYVGDPSIPGNTCERESSPTCDQAGSLTSVQPPSSGTCPCKINTAGPFCNQCKPGTFNLDSTNQFGCISCFCMGITSQCSSSNWYRQQVSTPFVRNAQDFKIVAADDVTAPIEDGIQFNQDAREIIYDGFPRSNSPVYYWYLPSQFLGDKVTSYGGALKYTIRSEPLPGGQSRNNAADVILMSANDIKLLYFGRDQVEPNRPQTVSVSLLEQYWQADNGEAANREQMLMALADVKGILIKATYTTNTRQAALSQVSLDIAEERNTGQSRAVAVEQCQCPAGYRGLSCEDCDVGFTRSDEGIYLGLCEPCNCNQHSSECDPETGVCLNCKDNTRGDECDLCDEGYEGDATRGRPDDCNRIQTGVLQCDCDERGSTSVDCQDGRCTCKTNVEGKHCDECRQGCFGLSGTNSEGCLECFCSGVTDQCQSSNLYRTEIPMLIIDSNHGFTLTDIKGNEVIKDGFTLVESENEIGYTLSNSRNQRIFWSLPPAFTGNKVTSYGGNLTITQRYSSRPGSPPTPDQDVLLIGNGVTLYWTMEDSVFQPNRQMTYSVPMRESFWTRIDQSGPHPASRSDLITVLSDVEVILIRATHTSNTQSTHLSDVSLETAVPQYTGQDVATDVEMCRCPPQYRGTSCELCAPGYYRDVSDRSDSIFGSCKRCPCSSREESCSASQDGRVVTCVCQQGYSGTYCNSTDPEPTRPPVSPTRPPVVRPTISISISEPTIQIVEAGSTVRFRCLGQSLMQQRVTLQWSREGGQLPRDRAIDDRQGLLVITDVRVSDSGTYICAANDGFSTVTERAVLNVGGSRPSPPRATVEPRFLEINEGEPAEFRCHATGNPAPNLRWTAENRPISREWTFDDGVFRIPAARKSDEGTYECIATSSSGEDRRSIVLYIKDTPVPAPRALTISPPDYNGPSGQTVQLSCVSGDRGHLYTVRWSRPEGNLPPSAVDRNGVLTIYNASPADSGTYVCTATSSSDGHREQLQASITIVPVGGPPSVRIEPERQTVYQGTLVEVRCLASGEPTPSVRWSKVGEELPRNVQVIGQLLRIDSVQVRDRGVYVCEAQTEAGSAQASTIIEVDRREPPEIKLYPETSQTVTAGGSAQIQCRIMGGIPSPTLRWTRPNGRPLGGSVQELPGGVLRFSQVTVQDAGQYTCHAENAAGVVTAISTLEIISMPRITLEPSKSIQHTVGERVRLECRATGEPVPSVVWTKYTPGVPVYSGERTQPLESLQSSVLEINRVTKGDEGSYTCTARNTAGVTEERLQLIVNDDRITSNQGRGDIPFPSTGGDEDVDERPIPPFTPTSETGVIELPQDVFRVPVGGRAEMRCQVRGNRDRIFLNWIRKDNAAMPAGYQVRDGVLYINNVEPSAAGEYSCLGISPSGQTLFTAKATLAVIAPPRIQLNPSRQVVRPGDNALITCSASGDQPMTIRWSALGRNFSPRVRVDQGRLYFTGIEVSDAGRYVCTASNAAGQADAAAEVVVSDHQTRPTVQAERRDQTTPVGSSIKLRCSVPPETQARNAQITWTRDGAALPRNSRVTGEELELVNVQVQDQGRYVCEVRNEDGSASDYVYLRVEPAASAPSVVVRIEPSQRLTRQGDTIDLRCVVTGNTAQVTWTKKWGSLDSNAQVYGNLLRISDVRQSNAGTYSCGVRTAAGRFDEDFELSLQDNGVMNHDAPEVETKSAPHGSTVMMDCRTDLEQPVKYTWSKQGGPLPEGSNEQEETLTLRDIGAADAGTYVCTASNANVKVEIPNVLVVTGVVPFFSQAPSSYMALPTLPDAYLTFSIEVSFKPESGDGLILYNGQQRGGGGDFISLGLNGSYIEFRFNVGSGPALIRSQYPINLGEWHSVKLHRTRKEGAMYVDGVGPIKGVALGRFQGLDLVEPLYVGGVPDFTDIHRLNGFSRGFVGCISRLVIGTVEHELVRDATLSHGVTTCETCAVNPCENRGVCQEANTAKGYTCICPSSFSGQNCDRVGQACTPGVCGLGRCVNREVDGFDCLCPFGRGGAKCEEKIDITEPAFADDAYIAYPTPKAVRRLNMALNINPRTLEDGVLLYCAQSDDGLGDFASLAIRDKRLEFRFDTGSGPAILRSDRDLVVGEWVTVSANRDSREGHLSVDNETPIHGRSPGDKRGLNLRTPLYVGGFDKQRVRVAQGVGVARGFQGCISNIQVSGMDTDMFKSLVDSANVEDCSSFHETSQSCDQNPCMNGGRCSSSVGGGYTCKCPKDFSGHNCEAASDICESQSPCQNGGTCVTTESYYNCRCPLGFGGEQCQNMADLNRDVSFNGDGFIEFRNSLLPHKDPNDKEKITIEFTTTEPNGLMLWHGQEAEADGKGEDYLSLAVVDGYLEFGYELGSGPALIRSVDTVDDGRRHKVVLRRQGSDGSIEIDQATSTMFGESGGLLSNLNTRGNIYIGGVENFALMTEGRYTHGFTGCIHKIVFQDVDINIGTNAVNGVNAQPCSNAESSGEDEENDNDILDNMDMFVQ